MGEGRKVAEGHRGGPFGGGGGVLGYGREHARGRLAASSGPRHACVAIGRLVHRVETGVAKLVGLARRKSRAEVGWSAGGWGARPLAGGGGTGEGGARAEGAKK